MKPLDVDVSPPTIEKHHHTWNEFLIRLHFLRVFELNSSGLLVTSRELTSIVFSYTDRKSVFLPIMHSSNYCIFGFQIAQ